MSKTSLVTSGVTSRSQACAALRRYEVDLPTVAPFAYLGRDLVLLVRHDVAEDLAEPFEGHPLGNDVAAGVRPFPLRAGVAYGRMPRLKVVRRSLLRNRLSVRALILV